MIFNILVAEDEAAQAELLKFNLESAGFRVRVVRDGEACMERLEEQVPDLLVLDWMLPKLSGIEVCRRVRADDGFKQLPIIMLTARGEEDDRVRGFEVGADDYVVKPYLPSEIVARIKAILRRARPELDEEKIEYSGIVMDLAAKRVSRDGDAIELSSTEFRLLRALLAKPGRVLSRDRLIDLAWGTGMYIEDRTVDVSVRRLRKALNEGGKKDLIRTVRGSGYALEDVDN